MPRTRTNRDGQGKRQASLHSRVDLQGRARETQEAEAREACSQATHTLQAKDEGGEGGEGNREKQGK